MHKAPSVTYPVGPCAWYDRVLWLDLMLVALAGLAVAVWGQGPRAMNVAVALVLWFSMFLWQNRIVQVVMQF
jgi:hypothetical protein